MNVSHDQGRFALAVSVPTGQLGFSKKSTKLKVLRVEINFLRFHVPLKCYGSEPVPFIHVKIAHLKLKIWNFHNGLKLVYHLLLLYQLSFIYQIERVIFHCISRRFHLRMHQVQQFLCKILLKNPKTAIKHQFVFYTLTTMLSILLIKLLLSIFMLT